jgi:hypothetical protein
MLLYKQYRSDIFCFADRPEAIIHLSDFGLAEKKPAKVLLTVNEIDIAMRVLAMGNQQGRLAIHLSSDDFRMFARLRDASPSTEIVLTA